MHAGLDDQAGVRLGRFARQAQGVADIVAHAVEDLWGHVVVGQDDRVLLPLQRVDGRDQRRLQAPLERSDPRLHLLPQRRCGRLYIRREGQGLEAVVHRRLPCDAPSYAQYEHFGGLEKRRKAETASVGTYASSEHK